MGLVLGRTLWHILSGRKHVRTERSTPAVGRFCYTAEFNKKGENTVYGNSYPPSYRLACRQQVAGILNANLQSQMSPAQIAEALQIDAGRCEHHLRNFCDDMPWLR
jgi:hypothetical protein